jgi:hypothetical protein
MKKFLIAAIAAVFCLGIVLPAAAQVKMSGGVLLDMYWFTASKETESTGPFGAIPGVVQGGTTLFNDREELQIALNDVLSNMRITYTSKDKSYGGTFGIIGGQINNRGTYQLVQMAQTYLWWQFLPNVRFKIGKINQDIGGLGPQTFIADAEYDRQVVPEYAKGPGKTLRGTYIVAGILAGNMATTSQPGMQAEIKINKMVTLKLVAFDPDDDETDTDNFTLVSTRGAGTTATQECNIPRFDVLLPVKYQNLYAQPKFMWLRKDYDQVAPNQDSEFDCWLVGVDASAVFGPFTFSGELIYGENLGAANTSGGGSTTMGPWAYADAAGYTHIVDTEDTQWFLQVKYQITPQIWVYGYYGEFEGQNDNNPTTAVDDNLTERESYGLNLWYAVAPNFFIIPQWTHYGYGDKNTYGAISTLLGAKTTFDLGDVDIYGVQFYIVF